MHRVWDMDRGNKTLVRIACAAHPKSCSSNVQSNGRSMAGEAGRIAVLLRNDTGKGAVMTYALVTPARNEADFIEGTIRAVLGQTIRPFRWMIVSDGSTDGTDALVGDYAARHQWIELLRMPERPDRHFGGKALAFNAAWEKIRHLTFDIIGSLDADISFGPDYFEYLLCQFTRDPLLGVAGTPFKDRGVQYDYRFSRKEHVSGACQLFRKSCFEGIAGYTPLKGGAIDLVAVVTARMKGWKTETFMDRVSVHHRPMGSATNRVVAAGFKSGYGDFRMGVHPIWQLLRSLYQMTRKPYVVSGLALLCGFAWGMIQRIPKPVSKAFVRFRRREQMAWLMEYGAKVPLVSIILRNRESRRS
jgi:biofilm PGA synthesis N-glycosyltransferase PgaC